MGLFDLDKLVGKRNGTGAITPNVSDEAAVKNYQIEELVAAFAAVNYSQTDPTRWKVYPKRNQAQSNTCVAQTIAKMAGILREQKTGEYVEYSATPIYKKRINKPTAGMVGTDALDLWRKDGVTLESLVQSQGMNDTQVDTAQVNEYENQVGAISRLDAYVVLPTRDFDLAISTMLATGKPLMVWHRWNYNEWDMEVPTLKAAEGSNLVGHHSTTLTPNMGIYQGQVGATTEDSWGSVGIEGMGVRWLTREFYNARNTFTAYPTAFKTYAEIGVDPVKPRYSFTRNLPYGIRLDKDVQALQKILQYEGLYPANFDATGNYLEVTRKAILDWQIKHGVPTDGLDGRLVGAKTRKALNDMYAV